MASNKIVITTIFTPSPALLRFSTLENFDLIVVGDRKTPLGWSLAGCDYSPWDDPRLNRSRLAQAVPHNHYSRKNLGYVLAMQGGATTIIDTDDDNFPLPNFGFPSTSFLGDTTDENLGFVNVYAEFTGKKIWPRGLPVRDILRPARPLQLQAKHSEIGVWQGLANGDPDVDALYRLTDNSECIFSQREPLVLARGTWSPFNSQNTLFRRELFPLLYLPVSVSFRFTDILRSFVAQPIMWANGYRVGFTEATVLQERNPHDYLADLVSEFKMYETTDSMIEILSAGQSPAVSILSSLVSSYEALLKNKIVLDEEMDCLDAWVEECIKHGFS